MKIIIGLGHQKNVGKDTFASFCLDILKSETRKLRIKRRGFADKLYEFLHSVYAWAGFQDKAYYDAEPNRKNDKLLTGFTVREELIRWGNFLRVHDPDIWRNANLKNNDFDILFITDMRYRNEFDSVKAQGGMNVRILKEGLPIPTDEADTDLNPYADRWDMTLTNNGSKAQLHDLAYDFVKGYILKRINL